MIIGRTPYDMDFWACNYVELKWLYFIGTRFDGNSIVQFSNSNSNIILQHIQYNVINNLNIWCIM